MIRASINSNRYIKSRIYAFTERQNFTKAEELICFTPNTTSNESGRNTGHTKPGETGGMDRLKFAAFCLGELGLQSRNDHYRVCRTASS
jgi:hypothetical protein